MGNMTTEKLMLFLLWYEYLYIFNNRNFIGETSAGKSTLINKILGMRIFKGKNRESTSTVCKVRNSENVMIKTEMEIGSVKEMDLSEIDITTKEGEKRLRGALKELTDMTVSKESKQFESVDINMPVPFLKVYISLSDRMLFPFSF